MPSYPAGPALCLWGAIFFCCLSGHSGCRWEDASQGPILSNSSSSVTGLAREVLQGLYLGDFESLAAKAVNRDEFRRHVWPELPISRPECGMSWEYVWNDSHRKSLMYLSNTLARQRGRKYDLVKVRFLGGVTEYEGYTLHRDARLVVRDESEKERELNVFGSVFEMGGEFKVMTYIVD